MKLNFKELRKNQKSKIVSSKEALKDVISFEWSEEVLNGNKKVIVGVDWSKDAIDNTRSKYNGFIKDLVCRDILELDGLGNLEGKAMIRKCMLILGKTEEQFNEDLRLYNIEFCKMMNEEFLK